MNARTSHYVQRLAALAGLSISRRNRIPADLDPMTIATIKVVRPYTATTPERVAALCEAVRYVVGNAIGGDIVECGVWKGGSMMAVGRTLAEADDRSRTLHLFDTFGGMVAPGPDDTFRGSPAADVYAKATRNGGWCAAELGEVKSVMALLDYPQAQINYVVGKVEDTLPEQAPERIAILRLDTDWYESTRHELETLYPRIVPGGVLIVDDYGYWDGARRAVDEYIAARRCQPLLHRIDDSGRMAIIADPA